MVATLASQTVGVLALQGDFAEHLAVLNSLSVSSVEVRSRDDLENVSALIIPGGESTTILKLLDRFDLRDPVSKRIHEGMPVFGTCAGAIVLADRVNDGEMPLGVMPLGVRRNAYGRQNESFEAEISVPVVGPEPVMAIFIRAPVFEEAGPEAEVLAEWADQPVLVRAKNMLASAFHPELAGENRVHRYFVEQIAGWAI